MNTVEYIKNEIRRLYETAPDVHVRVKMPQAKILLEGTPAHIQGVYKNIFQIEEKSSGYPTKHTFQYGDVLIGQVVIEELNYVPMVSILNKH